MPNVHNIILDIIITDAVGGLIKDRIPLFGFFFYYYIYINNSY